MKAVGPNKSHQSRTVASAVTAGSRKRKGGISPPTTLDLSGVTIHFPFKPYKCQEAYMRKVVESLQRKEHALLESPTGTGKTLCLLCATLAWQRDQHKQTLDAHNNPAADLKKEMDNDTKAPDMNSDTGTTSTEDQAPLEDSKQTKQKLRQSTLAPHVKVPTIIYASRTHSQLSQVVRELRNTRYRPKHAVLGSREQMCVNPKVKKSADTSAFDINQDCNKLSKARKCRYRNHLEGFQAPNPETQYEQANRQPVLDMEDLVLMGKTHKVCPFYYTRSSVQDAELVLLPYNYLFDKDARDTTLQEIQWKNAVVIFDEAHNLESFATDSASFDISNTDIAMCMSELDRVIQYMDLTSDGSDDNSHAVKRDNVTMMKGLFMQFEDYILNMPYTGANEGELMMKILTDGININHGNHSLFVDEVRKVSQLLVDIRGGSGKGVPKLEVFCQCVKRVFGADSETKCFAKAKSYRVHVTPKGGAQGAQQQQQGRNNHNNNRKGNSNSRTVSYWCFAPSLAMNELDGLGIRTILVTSGTLSPLPSYSMELGLSFPNTLENPHIIADEQIHVRVIGKGVSGKELTSSFQRRKDGDYYTELGNTLVSLAKVIPDGMLVFFPSYSVMETCLERWGCAAYYNRNNKNNNHNNGKATASFFAARNKKGRNSSNRQQYSFPYTAASIYGNTFGTATNNNTPWKRLIGTKSVVVEPRSTADLPDAIAEFHKFLDMPKSKGVALFGICRGKISEGIDFAGKQSRAVVITGLPFPPAFDPKVKLKREYLDSTRAAKNMRSEEAGGFDGSDTTSKASKAAPAKPNVLSGHEWYSQQAHRAVNQAIGRVIRNRSDYGAVLLLDSRYAQPGNQQGLSKWVRPHVRPDQGVGVAIGDLVKFYRQAAATAKEREDESKAIVLQYEEEEEAKRQKPLTSNVDDAFTKVAFVKNLNRDLLQAKANLKNVGNPDAKVTEDRKEEPVSYIAPENVVARVDLDTIVEKKESAFEGNYKRSSETAAKPQGVSSVFAASKAASTTSKVGGAVAPQSTRPPGNLDSKTAAAQFFKKAQKWFTSAEFKTIRKALVAMKQHGDKDDRKAYKGAAKEIVQLCCQRERFFGEHEKDHEATMLFLFFQVLPAARRKEVELLAMKGLFKRSSLGQLCKENLPPERYTKAISELHRFLHLLWCRNGDGHMLSDKAVFLREAQKVMTHLRDKNGTVTPSFASAFVKLVPSRFSSTTQAMLAEVEAARNIQRIKSDESKLKGEDAIDNRRFQRPHQAHQPLAFSSRSDDADVSIKSEPVGNVPTRSSSKDRKQSSQSSRQGSHPKQKDAKAKEPAATAPHMIPSRSGTGRPGAQQEATKPTSSHGQSGASGVQEGGRASSVRRETGKVEAASGQQASQSSSQGSLNQNNRKVNPYAKKAQAKSLSSYTSSLEKPAGGKSEEAARKALQARNVPKPHHAAPAYARTSELSKVGKPLSRTESSSKKHTSSDPVKSMLEKAEASPYVKKTTGDLVKSLKSKVPSNVHCMVCSKTAETPLLSECNHFACKDCWVQWLRRSETCPFCKAGVKPSSLSRVVFQDDKAKDMDVPSMSQLGE